MAWSAATDAAATRSARSGVNAPPDIPSLLMKRTAEMWMNAQSILTHVAEMAHLLVLILMEGKIILII